MSGVFRFDRISQCILVVSFCFVLLNCGGGSSNSSIQSGGGSSCNFQTGGNCSLSVNGVTRTYVLHVPQNFQPNVGGLVIAFHGAKESGSEFERVTGLSQKADKAGFAAAYPDGLTNPSGSTTWNGYFNPTEGANPPDDSGFAQQLILTLEANLHVNPKMVYVTGRSAGGYMAHRVAIDHADLVAAAGVVEGSLSVQSPGGSQVPPPANAAISILILHGDQDQVIDYCGDAPPTKNVVVTSQDQTFDYWYQTAANSCKTLDTTTNLCTGFLGTPTSITMKDATGCNSGAEVRIYRLIGGTHTWYQVPMNVPPGTSSQPYNPNLNSATGVSTDDILWNFFASHPKP
jgi:polyhydroxybutyrate depolymerase